MRASASVDACPYRRHRYPAEIIAHAVWLYVRLSLSLRSVEELLAERGVTVGYETIREWGAKVGPTLADGLRRRCPRPADARSWRTAAFSFLLVGPGEQSGRAMLLLGGYQGCPIGAVVPEGVP